MEELIRHTGVVMSVNGNMAHVAIVQTSACSACKAKNMCMSSESRQKEMDAFMTEPMVVGDKVEVEVREHLAWRAVLLRRSGCGIGIAGFDRAVLHRAGSVQRTVAKAVLVHSKKIVRTIINQNIQTI